MNDTIEWLTYSSFIERIAGVTSELMIFNLESLSIKMVLDGYGVSGMNERRYVGIDQDDFGGMSEIGRIIRDAWVFGIIPETEKCSGWSEGQLQNLYNQVFEAWQPFGHLASQLPAELRVQHSRIYEAAIESARQKGWSGEHLVDDESP